MRFHLLFLLLGASAGLVTAQPSASVSCLIDGQPARLVAIENETAIVEQNGKRQPAPADAKWTLAATGESLAALACWAPSHEITRAGEAEERLTPATPWRARVRVSLMPAPAEANLTTHVLREWQNARANAGALVVVWLIDGQPGPVVMSPLPRQTFDANAALTITLQLDQAGTAGQPIVLYWGDEGFVAAHPMYEHAATQAGALAILQGDTAALDAALAAGAKADQKNRLSHNLVDLAAGAGSVPALERLQARHRSLINAKAKNGTSPLSAAAATGRVDAVRWMLAAPVNAGRDGERAGVALLAAARNGHVDVVSELLTQTKGAQYRDLGVNALHAAFGSGHREIVETLWKANVRPYEPRETLGAVLVDVVKAGHEQLARFLLEQRVNPNGTRRELTPLHAGAMHASADLIQALIDAGAKADKTTSSGYTTLMGAAEGGNTAAARILLENKAPSTGQTREGVTALHIAARNNAVDIITLLLAHGAVRDARTKSDYTALDVALLSGAGDAARALVAAGATIELSSARAAEMLECAILHDIPEPLERALAAGWPPQSTLGGVWPAIRVAEIARAGQCEKLLRDAGATATADQPLPLANSRELDSPLRLRTAVKPDDPRESWEEYAATEVRVEFVVAGDGRVLFPRILESPDVRLAPAVFTAIKHWQFHPIARGGQPVATRAIAPILFPASTDRSFELNALDERPKPISRVAPHYPMAAKQAGANGSVVIGFVVATDGTVKDAYVVQSSHQIFEAPALACIQQWRFEPGKVGGRAVNTRMQQPIIFQISN